MTESGDSFTVSSNNSIVPILDFNNLNTTLTGDELQDNIIFGIALTIAAYFADDTLARLVYMRPRTWITGRNDQGTLSYHAQARMVVYDNLRRRVWRKSGLDVHPAHAVKYRGVRGYRQFFFVFLIAALSFAYDIAATGVGLPNSRNIFVDTEKIFQWRSVTRKSGFAILPAINPCVSSPLVDGANLVSTATWSRFEASFCYPKEHPTIQRNVHIVSLFRLEMGRSSLQIFTASRNITCRSESMTLIQDGSGTRHVEFIGSTESLTDNFFLNSQHFRHRSGFTLNKLIQTNVSTNYYMNDTTVISLDNSKPVPDRDSMMRHVNVHIWVQSYLRGTFEYDGEGSRLLQANQYGNYEPMENFRLKVATYNGTILPTFWAVILAILLLLLNVVARVCLSDPPGLAYEVILAHGRLCADKLLAGYDTVRIVTRSREKKNPTNCFIGYGVPRGFEAVDATDEFTDQDKVAARLLF